MVNLCKTCEKRERCQDRSKRIVWCPIYYPLKVEVNKDGTTACL